MPRQKLAVWSQSQRQRLHSRLAQRGRRNDLQNSGHLKSLHVDDSLPKCAHRDMVTFRLATVVNSDTKIQLPFRLNVTLSQGPCATQSMTDANLLDQPLTKPTICNAAVRPSQGISAIFRYLLGVKQGCALSPTLFGLYVDGLVKHLFEPADIDASTLMGVSVPLLLYADDLILISESASGLHLIL